MSLMLTRAMSRRDLVAIVINSVAGAGVLGLPGRMFAALGYYSIAAWVLCALIMSCIALCFAEVAGQFAATGGVYLYAYTTLGRRTGFWVGWLAWVSRLFSLATIGNLVVSYAGGMDARLLQPGPRVVAVTVIFALLTLPLLIGIRQSAWVNNALTVVKLGVFGAFVLLLFWFDGGQNSVHRSFPPATAWQAAMLQMSFAFIGVESAMINSGEMRDPVRDPPVVLAIGLVVIATLYVAIQVACIGTVPDLALSERPVIDGATQIFGPLAGLWVGVGGLVCMLGTLYAVIFTGSRLPFALAENGQLPRWLAAVDPRFGTPAIAIMVTSVAAWALTLYTTFMGALTVTATTRIVGYVTTCLALLILRRRRARSGFRVPFGRVVAALSIAACLWLMWATNLKQLASVMAIVGAGLLVSAGWAIMRRRGTNETAHP